MLEGKEFLRTDLVVEEEKALREGGKEEKLRGVRFEEERKGKTLVTRLFIESDEGAALLKRSKGNYATLSFGKPWLMDETEHREAVDAIAGELSRMLAPVFEKKPEIPSGESTGNPTGNPGEDWSASLEGSEFDASELKKKQREEERCVLAVGLGNRKMTADAVGPSTVDQITVTRHLASMDRPLFESLRHRSVAAITPGVLGDTGMESAETVKAVVRQLKPRAIIAVDALAARSTERLATTVQLCDKGIHPGSGVGNDRPGLNEESLGVPVIAVGVPMVVDSSTLVYDVLENAGITELPAALRRVLENGKSFFVSIKEADAAVKTLSEILSEALDEALALAEG